jgi:hypothetical protein
MKLEFGGSMATSKDVAGGWIDEKRAQGHLHVEGKASNFGMAGAEAKGGRDSSAFEVDDERAEEEEDEEELEEEQGEEDGMGDYSASFESE